MYINPSGFPRSSYMINLQMYWRSPTKIYIQILTEFKPKCPSGLSLILVYKHIP